MDMVALYYINLTAFCAPLDKFTFHIMIWHTTAETNPLHRQQPMAQKTNNNFFLKNTADFVQVYL